MQKLFAYGTLQSEDVQQDLFGRILQGTPEILVGYETTDSNNTITGILYEITQTELRQVDLYEGLHYKRVEVQLQSNQKAWAYSAAI
jgi:gamma-glutamylcyclotransferase (GGCT)/AIG2-like uncharacterized protein YtfP